MFDENGNKKTKRDAEDAVRKFVYAIMGLNENSTKRDRNRAMKKHGIEKKLVLQTILDKSITTGKNGVIKKNKVNILKVAIHTQKLEIELLKQLRQPKKQMMHLRS